MLRARLQSAWDLFIASDPGLSRLIGALQAGLAIGVGIAAQYGFAQLAHPLWSGGPGAVTQHQGVTLLAMLLGGILAMISAIAVSETTPREQAITLLGAPAPMLATMAGAIALSTHRVAGLVVLTLVTGIGTYARALGPVIGQRAQLYGMLLFMGYFFGFLAGSEIPLGDIYWVAAILWLAAFVNLALRLAIFNPIVAGAIARARISFTARAHRAIEAIIALLAAGESEQRHRRRRLHRAMERLNENALILDGQLADPRVRLDAAAAERVHEQLFELELDLDNLARAAAAVPGASLPPELRAQARGWAADLYRGETAAARAFSEDGNAETALAGISERGRDLMYALAALTTEVGEALHGWIEDRPAEDAAPGSAQLADLYDSPVALFAGNLSGSSQASRAALDPALGRGLAARLHLDGNAQNALRVMAAVGVAAAAGSIISSQRFYWAVIAVFISFMGANTTSEQLVKAFNRVLGTLVGIVIGSVVAQAIGPSTWSLAVILPALMIGIYFQRVSYALMSAGITTMIAVLYVQLGEYSSSLLALRLGLTALGAVIAMLTALLVFPVRTKRVIRQAALTFLDVLRTLVEDIPGALGAAAGTARPTADARSLDDALMQLLVTARPLSREPWGHHDLRHNLGLLSTAALYARNLAGATGAVGDPGETLATRIAEICALESEVIARVSAAIRDGGAVAPGENPLAPIADTSRRLAEAGVARTDPRQRMLRSLARIDATLDRFARNLSGEDDDDGPDPVDGLPPADAPALAARPA